MKIAIIGTGISGLVAAHHLHKHHDIQIFESNSYVGGHTNTIDVLHNGKNIAVDTGFIVFNDKTYPNFIDLIRSLGVAYKPTTMGFSVKSDLNNLEYNGSNINGFFAQRSRLLSRDHYKLALEIIRFNKTSQRFLQNDSADITLGEYLFEYGYSRYFIDHYIIPMGAAIWSSDPYKMFYFPARAFLNFFKNHGLLSVNDQPQWYVIENGSRSYVEKLTQPFRHLINLNTAVRSIRRQAYKVFVKTEGEREHTFDKIIIATHSDQALKLLEDPDSRESEILGSIKYQYNEAVLHTDDGLLPKRRHAWSAWNYHIPAVDSQKVTLTYNMNILQGIDSADQFCVTLNNRTAINPGKIIKCIDYDHPVFDVHALNAQKRWSNINGVRNTFYCGAYWGHGFHEDGVNSAINVVNLIAEQDSHEKLYIQRAS